MAVEIIPGFDEGKFWRLAQQLPGKIITHHRLSGMVQELKWAGFVAAAYSLSGTCMYSPKQFGESRGDIPTEQCIRNAKRLAQAPDHLLSRQSGQSERGQCEGAVLGRTHIISVMSAAGDLDELNAAILCHQMGDMREGVIQLLQDQNALFGKKPQGLTHYL